VPSLLTLSGSMIYQRCGVAARANGNTCPVGVLDEDVDMGHGLGAATDVIDPSSSQLRSSEAIKLTN
jgi:hypothetical protein